MDDGRWAVDSSHRGSSSVKVTRTNHPLVILSEAKNPSASISSMYPKENPPTRVILRPTRVHLRPTRVILSEAKDHSRVRRVRVERIFEVTAPPVAGVVF